MEKFFSEFFCCRQASRQGEEISFLFSVFCISILNQDYIVLFKINCLRNTVAEDIFDCGLAKLLA